MAGGNQNFTLYTRVQFDNKSAVKATEELKKVAQDLKLKWKESDNELKKMLADTKTYSAEQIAEQRKLTKALNDRYQAQKKAVKSAYQDLSMLRKATKELDGMSLRQLKQALAEANKQMNQMGSKKHTKEELQGLVEIADLLKTRIHGIEKGFSNLWAQATSGAKMSMVEMENLIGILDREGSAVAKNEQHYQNILHVAQKLRTELANQKGLSFVEKGLTSKDTKGITDAQLANYKKFYEGIANSANSSAKQVADANSKIAMAQKEIDGRNTTAIKSGGSDLVSRVKSGVFAGTIQQTEEAIKKLQEYRKTLNTFDSTGIRTVDDAIERLKKNIEKTNENTIIAQRSFEKWVANGVLPGNSAELEKMKASLEQWKKTIDKTDTKKLQDVKRMLVAIEKEQAKVASSERDWQKFMKNLNSKSLNELKDAYKTLQNEVNNMSRSQEKYNEKAAQMRQIDKQIKSMTQNMGQHASQMENAASRLKNYVMIYLGFNAVMQKVQQAWSNMKELADQMTNVRKVTGMTTEQVEAMTQAIMDIDTRTANKELMELAEQAGKLGYNTSEAITQFVKAGQVITNTLGEIGGAESITELLKISDLVNKDDAMDVEESLNRVGSAVLNIGNNSKASYAGVVEFTKRMGAIGAQSKLTMPQIMALAGTFSSLGGNVESSSTAMQRVLMGLQTNTAAVARATNTDLQALNQALMANADGQVHSYEALMLVLENLRDKGVQGINDFLKAIGGRNNTQAKAALSLLVQNLDVLDRQLVLAEIGYQDGTIATQEFEKANDNLAGVVARIGNEFYEMTTIIEDSHGIIYKMAKGVLAFSKGLKNCHGITIAFVTTIAVLIGQFVKSAVVMYQSGKALEGFTGSCVALLQIIGNSFKVAMYGLISPFTKATNGVNKLKRSFDALKASLASNPITALAVVVASAVAIFSNWNDKIKETRKAVNELKDANAEEMGTLESLRVTIQSVTASENERKNAINEFNSKFGEYLSNLLTEENYVNRLAIAYNEAAAAIQNKTAQQIESEAEKKSLDKYGDDIKDKGGTLEEKIQGWASKIIKENGRSWISGSNDEKHTGSQELKGYIRQLITEDPSITSSKIRSLASEKFKNDTRFKRTEYDSKLTVMTSTQSIFGYADVQNAINDYVDVVRMQIKEANKDRQEAKVYRQSANLFQGSTFDELMKYVERSDTKDYDKRKAYEQMFKIFDNELQGNEKEVRRVSNYNNKAKYNDLLKRMKPWGENSGDWENMGGEDLAAIVDFFNTVQKEYRSGQDFMRTFAQKAPTGVTLPDSMQNWNHDNVIEWARSNWKLAKETLWRKNYANGDGNFKDDPKSGSKKEKNDMDMALARLDEYYKRQEEIIENSLNSQEITEAEANRRLLANEAEHLLERQNLRNKFIDKTTQFTHNYITELMKGIEFDKIEEYLKGDGKKLVEGIRLNIAKDATKIQTDLRAYNKKIEDILIGEDSFTKLFDKTKGELDILGLLMPGIGKDKDGKYQNLEEEIQSRMDFIFQNMADAVNMDASDLKDAMKSDSTVAAWMLGLSDEQIETLRKRMVNFNDVYRKELRKQANEIEKQLNERNAENGFDTRYADAEGMLNTRKNRYSMFETASQGQNWFGNNPADDTELQLYDLKIQKSKEYIEQIKLEMAARIASATTEEEQVRLREEQQYLIDKHNKDIADSLNARAEKQSELAYKQIERFRPYADMVNQFAEDFGGSIFGDKEDREKAAKALLTSFIKTTGQMLAQWLSYLAAKEMADKMATAGEIDREGSSTIASLIFNGAKGTGQEVGRLGWAGFAVGAAITAAITALVAMVTSKINESKSELGVSTGKLSTGMLTYADGRYPTYADGTVGGITKVDGADGQTYNATYKPNLTTGEYSRPHLGIVGEKGAELIVDHDTFMGLKRNAPHILQGIYDMHRYGRLSLDYPALSRSATLLNGSRVTVGRGVRTYADGNINDVIGGVISNGNGTDGASASTNDRLADVLERLMANGIQARINMYGKDELYESMQKANKFMRGK